MAGYCGPVALHLSTSSAQPKVSQAMSFLTPSSAPPTVHNNALSGRLDTTPIASFYVGPDGNMIGTKPVRARRKSAPGLEQVKHRRTRSGCFTCRQRRVKCDELRPQCERCMKGARPCTYPEVVPTKSNRAKREKPQIKEECSSVGEPEEDEWKGESMQTAIPVDPALNNGVEVARSSSWSGAYQTGMPLAGASLQSPPQDPTPSPQTENVFGYPDSSAPTSPAESLRRTASHASLGSGQVAGDFFRHLTPDVIYYWSYYRQNMNHTHYSINEDSDNFFKTTFLDVAMQCEPLTYAVVAFACFNHHHVTKSGTFDTFLEYYNKAVSLLRIDISSKTISLGHLFTMLQLASFEEYLRDSRNMMDHRNAAAKLASQLFGQDAWAANPDFRAVQSWLSHFDTLKTVAAGVAP